MKLDVCGKKSLFESKGLAMVTDFLECNSAGRAVIFSDSRNQSLYITSHLEMKLDLKKLSVDVLNVNGSLDKTDKCWQICLFCNDRHRRRAHFWALVRTTCQM